MNVPAQSPTDRRAHTWVLALALLLTILAYARVLHGEFQLDDAAAIETNPAVKAGTAALSRIEWRSLAARPLTTATFALDYAFGGLDPWSYHLVNLVVHLAVALLLWRLALEVLRRAGLPGAEVPAAVAAGTFALHPLNSQAVSYVCQRSESLAALFAVATVLLLVRAERADRAGLRFVLACCALATFGLGLTSKVSAVIAPALWAILAFALPAEPELPLRRRAARVLSVLAPLLVAGAVAAASTFAYLRGVESAGFSVAGLGPWAYLLTQTRAILLYLRLLAWPAGQNVDHDLPLVQSLDGASAAIGVAFLAAIGAATWLLARPPVRWSEETRVAARVGAFGILWWFLALAPTSSIVPVADPVMEHRAYLASFGPILAATVIAARLLAGLAAEQRARAAFLGVAVAWGLLGASLHARNAVWETRVALWSDAAAKSPRRLRAQANLAFSLQRSGDLEGAIARYRQALTLPETAINRHVDLEHYLGAALLSAGRPAEAAPVLFDALQRDPWNLDVATTAAMALLDLGRPADAEKLASNVLRQDPASGPTLNTLGESLVAQGRLQEALDAFQRAVAIDPGVAIRQLNTARVAAQLGRRELACEALLRYWKTGQRAPEAGSLAASLACPIP